LTILISFVKSFCKPSLTHYATQGIVGEATLFNLIQKNPDIVVLLDEFSRAHEANRNAFFSAFQSHVQDKKTGDQVKTDRVTFILTTNTGQDAMLKSSGVLEEPPRWNSSHNRALPEVEAVIQSGLQEFQDDPMLKDKALNDRMKTPFMFLPNSPQMNLQILNMTIAREIRSNWAGCTPLQNDIGCYCYGCKQSSHDCKCESDWKINPSGKVVFSHRAKLQLLTQISKEGARAKKYSSNRKLNEKVNQLKRIMMHQIKQCNLFDGDGLIIDYDFHNDMKTTLPCDAVGSCMYGKVGAFYSCSSLLEPCHLITSIF
jgi:hypothetical protein